MVMQALATVSSRPIVISRSNDHVFPSSGPLITSRTYIAGGLRPPAPAGPFTPERTTMTEDIAEDIEPDTLREVELLQARDLLGALVGQKVTAVRVEDNR